MNSKIRIIALILLISIGILYNVSGQEITNLKSAKPIKFSGSFGTGLIFYNADGIEDRQEPFSYGINASANVTLYNTVIIPISLTWYNNESDLNNPFNQYGMSPKYKWITAHFGYRSLNFSEYTLNGQTFLGAGVELNPGKFRMAAIYGKFNKNSVYDPYTADSLPDYTRKGWALKLGYGSAANYIDFSMLRIGDNTDNYVKPTDTTTSLVTPEQNMAYGVAGKLSLIKKLTFEIDGSISFYTGDRKAERYTSIDDNWLSFSNNFMTINQTTEYYTALKSSLTYRFTNKISTGFSYKRIDPDYQSMGAYFFSTDIENITINQSCSFLKDKINARGSLGLQHDNLDNTKQATSKRTIGSLSLSYNINQNFYIDANYSNFTTNQKAGTSALIDSLKLYQTNRTISISPRYTKVTENRTHVVLLNCNFTGLDDKNKTTEVQTETNSTLLLLNYLVGFLPQKLTLSFSYNHTKLENNLYDYTMEILSAGVSKTMLDDKLSFSWNNSFAFSDVNSDKGTTLNTSLVVNYNFAKKHAVNINIYYIKNSFDENASTSSYNELRGEFNYVFTF